MADIVSPYKRSRMMSGIRGKDTKPEIMVRKGLHAMGFRFRLHDPRLPGKPDLVLPKHRAIVMVHGCFWHGHDCHLFKWPSTREDFWRAKIGRNRQKDAQTLMELDTAGWRVLTVWECAIKGKRRLSSNDLFERIANWLVSDSKRSEIKGD